MPITVEGLSSFQAGRSIADWVRQSTIDVAERALREEVGRGFDNQPVVITDGVPRRDYLAVKPFGTIEFAARANIAEIVMWALNRLQQISPVKTGRYASTHTIMLNGTEIGGNIALALRNARPGDKVQIVNPQPYARKLEGATARKSTGRGRRKPSSRQAPNGIYRVVQREVVNRYGKTLFVDFKYVPLNLGVKVWGDRGGSYYNRLRKNGGGWVKHKVARVRRDQVYPALQLFVKAVDGPMVSTDVR